MNLSKIPDIDKLKQLVLRTAYFPMKDPIIRKETTLNNGLYSLTDLEMAEVLILIEEEFGIQLKIKNMSKDWFSNLLHLEASVAGNYTVKANI